ncbi:MAG: Rab family GTPase [Candidatus Hodarchaeota archaeon]
MDFLTRIQLKGTVPSVFTTLFKNKPDKKLSGKFFTSLGFDKLGKSFIFDGKKSHVVFVDCNSSSCKDTFCDAVVYFFRFNNRESYEHLFDIFDLYKEVDDTVRHQRTIIGIYELGKEENITLAEREQLRTNKHINYHEILSSDTEKLEEILFSIIKKSLPLDQILLKIICLGSSTRKTEIIQSYTNEEFSTNYLSTLGVDLTNKRLNINGLRVKLIIVDTTSQKSFEKLRPSYYRGSKGGIIFFDFDDRNSIHAIKNWKKELTHHLTEVIPITLAGIMGNKSNFYIGEVKSLAQELKLDLYAIKDDLNVMNDILINITKQIITSG